MNNRREEDRCIVGESKIDEEEERVTEMKKRSE